MSKTSEMSNSDTIAIQIVKKIKIRWMAFSIYKNDFFDYYRFSYGEVTLNSDFFEISCPKTRQFESKKARSAH